MAVPLDATYAINPTDLAEAHSGGLCASPVQFMLFLALMSIASTGD